VTRPAACRHGPLEPLARTFDPGTAIDGGGLLSGDNAKTAGRRSLHMVGGCEVGGACALVERIGPFLYNNVLSFKARLALVAYRLDLPGEKSERFECCEVSS
jgi:hypothetical protein